MEKYATVKQINFIKQLLDDLRKDESNYNLIGLTQEEARTIIDDLLKERDE